MAKFRPLRGGLRVTSPFGERANPLDPDERGEHNGVDYAAAVGSSLFAIDDGVVTKVNETPRGGRQLFVRLDDGERWAFSHLLDVGVVVGQRFKAGDIVALTGDTGAVTGPHVHVQRQDRNGRLVDSAPLLLSLPEPPRAPVVTRARGGGVFAFLALAGLAWWAFSSNKRG